MILESDSRPIQLPDRKAITLCEAVTAFSYGKAIDALMLMNGLVYGEEPTGEQSAKAEELIGLLQRAAYAGRIKFRALKNGESPADGHKDIDHLYFSNERCFHWVCDQIWSCKLSAFPDQVSRPAHFAEDWYDVHLDREQFEALLRDMGVSVQQNPNDEAPGERKTFTTGMPGRPTSKHLIQELARRRLNVGDYPPTLVEFSKQLADELIRAEPKAVPMKPKTVGNAIRPLWHGRQKLPKTAKPS